MSDKFSIIGIKRLYQIIEKDFSEKNEIFGIPEELFFRPSINDTFKISRYGQILETPIGIAAGPHSQMAQNIISAWLCGARYIELKTIQTLDEINVSKPCIDMQDEGYNCEWSQELKIHETFDEYLKAWILIHLLKHKLNFEKSEDIGVIFNMSAGYNMDGMLKENVQWFFNKMENCKAEKEKYIELLEPFYPEITSIYIPNKVTDNITLSTMHGCPPEEIENIGLYLINEKKFNTTIKLNPTLLGSKELREILNTKLGFKTEVPDIAFEHDLKYADALKLINSLQQAADKNNVQFNLKLTNTLESINNKNIFSAEEKMMYMSGRALHPISINLAKKLQNEFNGKLDISFCAGADCFNISEILNCGLQPVTICSDILKPGGYGRLLQYINNIRNNKTITNKLEFLNKYADNVISEKAYIRDSFHTPDIKTSRALNYFDCIHPPCVDTCPTNQDIPDYLYLTSIGEFEKAFEVILKKNPFPASLGMVCDHLCQSKCTRINYDDNIKIREVKRFIADYGNNENFLKPAKENGFKVSIIGAGPSGLACAYFLRLAGFTVNVYESKNISGGMVADAIPAFRLRKQSIEKDIERIKNLGVNIHYSSKIDSTFFEKIQKESDFIYIATGAQTFKKLGIVGENSTGVLDAFDFLSSVKSGNNIEIGNNVIIIGGGNTAMDVARTAYRMVPANGKVTVVYRRTIHEMPADAEEIAALIDEGIEIIELSAPEKILSENGKVISLICSKMKLGEPDSSGRAKPIKIEHSEFSILADTIIPALGQDVDIDFIKPELLKTNSNNYETQIKNIFIGGDAMRGAATIVKAVGDGRKVASEILNRTGINYNFETEKVNRGLKHKDYIVKKSTREKSEQLTESAIENRKNFDIVISPLTKEQAVAEAKRCLLCDDICNICVTVCPNRANYSYFIEPKIINIYKAIKSCGNIITEKTGVLNINQNIQVLNIGDFCNECGNCTTFCPTSGKPFKDKPKFYLTEKSFKEIENGFTINKSQGKTILFHKTYNETSCLCLVENEFIYESKHVKATFNKFDFSVKNVEFLNNNIEEFEFTDVVNMFALFDAAKNLY
ncbi:MAG: putative selenate reductase subunit YgfK [Bacteroidia bacterium]|nr:putative selenate reductase subunit YgfK [Bacteroidia bacterium]